MVPSKKRITGASSGNNRNCSHADSSSSVIDDEKNTTSTSNTNSIIGRLMERFQLTTYGSIILTIAIVLGLILNKNNSNIDTDIDIDIGIDAKFNINTNLTVDRSFGAYWSKACDSDNKLPSSDSNKVWCGDGRVEPTRRTLQSSDKNRNSIHRGDQLVEIPRSLQIWELDAIRSDIIQTEHLLKARHSLTENPLAGGSFLAIYLALERQRLIVHNIDDDADNDNDDEQDGKATTENSRDINNKEGYLRSSYLQSLPSWKELSDRHPILMSRSNLANMLGHHSWNFAVVVMYQDMIDSEYNALTIASPKIIGQKISLKEYQAARIHVLSRSFNPGPDACLAEVNKYLSQPELERLQSEWGIGESTAGGDEIGVNNSLFRKGCHAMVPILDMLNSHPYPNVVYKYQMEKQSFVINAKTDIPPQWELMNSYGKYSDAHLYAKFGFVNGDGTGYTQASIALFHRPLDVQIGQEFTMVPNQITKIGESPKLAPMDKIPNFQKIDLKRYLQYDDGYQNCVQKDLHPSAFRLKQLKWIHLANIANEPKAWIVSLQPRVPQSRPKKSSNMLISESPPKIDPRKLRMDLTHLVETCRLLALTIDDYDGNAIKVLEDNLGNNTFVVTKGSDALEYRSLMFLARLAGTALLQYRPVTPEKEYQNVLQLNKESLFGNKEWIAAQLRLGEMQSLHAVSGTAHTYAKKLGEKEEGSFSYEMREKSCPKEYTAVLDEDK